MNTATAAASPSHRELDRLQAKLQEEETNLAALRQNPGSWHTAAQTSMPFSQDPGLRVPGARERHGRDARGHFGAPAFINEPTPVLDPGSRFPGGARGPSIPADVGTGLEPKPSSTPSAESPKAADPMPTNLTVSLPLPPMSTVRAPGNASQVSNYGPDGMPASEILAANDDPQPRHRAFAEHCRQLYIRGELQGFEVLDPSIVFLDSKPDLSAANKADYLVQPIGDGLPRDSVGLVYRYTKMLEDVDSSATAVWGITITGVDEGDGWVRVGERYLPISINGTQVLTPKDSRDYFVDNRELQTDCSGLAYRFSKRLDDMDPREGTAGGPSFGSTVMGVDQGDGWLRVGDRFLPMEVGGARVLTLVDHMGQLCSKCGNKFMDDSEFCRICGTHRPDRGGDLDLETASRDEVQQELNHLYQEFHRRMLQAGMSSGVPLGSPLPQVQEISALTAGPPPPPPPQRLS